MALKDGASNRKRQQILSGANFALYTVIVVALIVVVNWFVSNHDKRWDMTPNKKYSLSDQTRKLLKGLDRQVDIYAFDKERDLGARRDVLSMFSTASNHVKVSYIDPERKPADAKRFGVRSYGTIVVAAGERHTEVQGEGEQGITNALISVLKGQRTVCFVQAHGEKKLDNSDRDGYDRFKKGLSDENYQTKTLPLLEKLEIPDDCTMVVIAGPQDDYTPPETDLISKFMQAGGRALVMMDAGVELPNLTKLVSEWGVTAHDDLVIDENPIAQMFGTEPYMPLIFKYGTNPIVQPLSNRATLFPMSRSFDVGKDAKPGITADSLGETSGDSYGVAGWTPKIKEIQFHEGKDTKGPLSVAVAGSISAAGTDKREGRFVVLGSSQIAMNEALGFQADRDFMMNSINWLSADEDLISIRPSAPESQHLDMNQAQMNRLFFLGVLGIPLLIIMAGVLVWWQRR